MDTALDTPLRFVIHSDFAEGRQVQHAILEGIARHHFGPDATFAIRLALEEALINAIKHGNKFDPNKVVRVEASITPQVAEIIIEDEGTGFQRACIPDPTTDENVERLHGRGVMLIESYMDEVNWQSGGRRIRMVRRNDDAGR
jgi:serine/threonine-protein kinase RsbW